MKKPAFKQRHVLSLRRGLMRPMALSILTLAIAPAVEASTPGAAVTPSGPMAAFTRIETDSVVQNPSYVIDHEPSVTRNAGLKTPAFSGYFTLRGPAFRTSTGEVKLRLSAWGRAGALNAVTLQRRAPHGNRIEYRGRGITEWWRTLPLGYEQGFVISQAPAGHGQVVLELTASRAPQVKGHTLVWGSLHYGALEVRDAEGRVLPATLSANGELIRLSVDARHATYPLIIDPLVWLQQKITMNNSVSGDYFGSAVAISGNGATALIGESGENNGQGVAYIFTRQNGVWTEVAELAPAAGEANEHFGSAVTLSSDGKTALIGAWNKTVNGNTEQGAAYVFTTTDGWATHTQAAELTASDGNVQDDFGNSVALSANGETAMVGSPSGGSIDQGAAYVFTTSNNWATYAQTAELIPSDAGAGDSFAQSVSLSDNGAIALMGAPGRVINGNLEQGAAYVYTLNNGNWSKVTELTANNGVSEDSFGGRVALSAGGTAAVIAAYGTNNFQGSAYIFNTSDNWATSTQTTELAANDGATWDQFGWDVAISADNATALVGSIGANVGANIGQGKAYVFTGSSGAWTQEGDLTESDGAAYDAFASTVALSSDGATALMSSSCHPYDQSTSTCGPGAAYVFSLSNLSAAINAPATIQTGGTVSTKYIVTNAASTTSSPVTVEFPGPYSNASYVSSDASQGSCSYDASSEVATCNLGDIAGNGGSAWATITLKATGSSATSIDENGEIADSTPDLVQNAITTIQTSSGSGGSTGGSGSSSSSGGGALGLGGLALLALTMALTRRRRFSERT